MSGEVIILRQHAIKFHFTTDFNEHALFFYLSERKGIAIAD